MLLDAHNIHFGPDVEKQENKYQPEVNSTIVREAVSTHVHRMRLLGATEMGSNSLDVSSSSFQLKADSASRIASKVFF